MFFNLEVVIQNQSIYTNLANLLTPLYFFTFKIFITRNYFLKYWSPVSRVKEYLESFCTFMLRTYQCANCTKLLDINEDKKHIAKFPKGRIARRLFVTSVGCQIHFTAPCARAGTLRSWVTKRGADLIIHHVIVQHVGRAPPVLQPVYLKHLTALVSVPYLFIVIHI